MKANYPVCAIFPSRSEQAVRHRWASRKGFKRTLKGRVLELDSIGGMRGSPDNQRSKHAWTKGFDPWRQLRGTPCAVYFPLIQTVCGSRYCSRRLTCASRPRDRVSGLSGMHPVRWTDRIRILRASPGEISHALLESFACNAPATRAGHDVHCDARGRQKEFGTAPVAPVLART